MEQNQLKVLEKIVAQMFSNVNRALSQSSLSGKPVDTTISQKLSNYHSSTASSPSPKTVSFEPVNIITRNLSNVSKKIKINDTILIAQLQNTSVPWTPVILSSISTTSSRLQSTFSKLKFPVKLLLYIQTKVSNQLIQCISACPLTLLKI